MKCGPGVAASRLPAGPRVPCAPRRRRWTRCARRRCRADSGATRPQPGPGSIFPHDLYVKKPLVRFAGKRHARPGRHACVSRLPARKQGGVPRLSGWRALPAALRRVGRARPLDPDKRLSVSGMGVINESRRQVPAATHFEGGRALKRYAGKDILTLTSR